MSGVAGVVTRPTVPKILRRRLTRRGASPFARGGDTLTDVNETTSADSWLTLPDLAEQLGVRISEVRRWLDERQLVAVRRGERKVLSVPAAFIGEDGPLPELAGTFTVLADGRFSDEEIVEWMFAHDETLPGGTPIGAIRAGFKTEVRRRAMEEAL